jgi:predicted AAA+ superfamily ATPase
MQDLARDADMSPGTVREWLSVLEASGIIYLLKPYFNNFGKRIIRAPKLYFTDPGLVCRLMGIRTSEQLFLHPNKGAIFETLMVADFLKSSFNEGLGEDCYFWRDNTGAEVDLIIERNGKPAAIEIKSSATFSNELLKGLLKWQSYTKAVTTASILVYGGSTQATCEGVRIVPWNKVGAALEG